MRTPFVSAGTLALVLFVSAGTARAAGMEPLLGQSEAEQEVAEHEERPTAEEGRGIVRRLIFYVPNRAFDLLDVVRLRFRLGPGIAVGARATKPLSLFAGAYTSLYVGLRGPRGEPQIPWPIGEDSRAGVQASVVDASTGAPGYGPLEVGAGFQLLVFGLDVGVAAYEVLDLAAGLVLIDLRDDDF